MLDAVSPICKSSPSIEDVKETVTKLRGGNSAGICNMSAELFKALSEAMIGGLHAVLAAVWHSSTIPLGLKRGVHQYFEWERDCNNYSGITLFSISGKVLANLFMPDLCASHSGEASK